MKAMTVEEFDRLAIRDFYNGAVRDAIRAALKELEGFKRCLALFSDEEIHSENIRRRYEYDKNDKPLWEVERIPK